MKKYLLVMEYADGGSLRNYLKENFDNLNWKVKYKLSYQLAYAVSCLHDEGIVHRDLVSYCFFSIKLFKIIFNHRFVCILPFYNSIPVIY